MILVIFVFSAVMETAVLRNIRTFFGKIFKRKEDCPVFHGENINLDFNYKSSYWYPSSSSLYDKKREPLRCKHKFVNKYERCIFETKSDGPKQEKVKIPLQNGLAHSVYVKNNKLIVNKVSIGSQDLVFVFGMPLDYTEIIELYNTPKGKRVELYNMMLLSKSNPAGDAK